MKAIQMGRFGGVEVLDVIDAAIPEPAADQVLVRVHAAGVNFADTLMRQNRYALTPELPAILGHEVSGVIEGVGSQVSGLTVGMRVAAPLFAAGIWFGGYAEYAAIDADLIVPLPDALSFEHATALMVQGLTAHYLIQQAPPRGKSVLVSAAAGGVGTILVQLAKRAGAKTVMAAASTDRKLDVARSLGADVGINYANAGWGDRVRAATGGAGADIIYESAGGEVTTTSLQALAPLGQLVIYGALNIQSFNLGVPELLGLIFKNQSLTGFAVAPLLTAQGLRSALKELFGLALAGDVRVTIGGHFALEQAADAHRAIEERRTIGKIVLAA